MAEERKMVKDTGQYKLPKLKYNARKEKNLGGNTEMCSMYNWNTEGEEKMEQKKYFM